MNRIITVLLALFLYGSATAQVFYEPMPGDPPLPDTMIPALNGWYHKGIYMEVWWDDSRTGEPAFWNFQQLPYPYEPPAPSLPPLPLSKEQIVIFLLGRS